MSSQTYRNYDRPKPSYNQILECYEYCKKSEEAWNRKFIEEGRELTRSEKLNDIIHFLPKEIRWIIEADLSDGASSLANHLNRTVIVEYENVNKEKLPKEALDNYRVRGPGGQFEIIRYARGLPAELVFNPTEGENKSLVDGIKVRLVIRPNKNHYIHNAEMRTDKLNDYCECCMHFNTSKAATVGTGDKSAKKTKGRSKRERAQLFYANGGVDVKL